MYRVDSKTPPPLWGGLNAELPISLAEFLELITKTRPPPKQADRIPLGALSDL